MDMQANTARRSTSVFPVWTTIKLGTHPNKEDLLLDATRVGRFHESAIKVVRDPAFKVETERSEVDLVLILTASLKFKRGDVESGCVHAWRIYEQAVDAGLGVGAHEVGLQLWRQQPSVLRNLPARWIQVAMNPIDNMVFNIIRENDGKETKDSWFRANWGHGIMPLTEYFVFTQARQ